MENPANLPPVKELTKTKEKAEKKAVKNDVKAAEAHVKSTVLEHEVKDQKKEVKKLESLEKASPEGSASAKNLNKEVEHAKEDLAKAQSDKLQSDKKEQEFKSKSLENKDKVIKTVDQIAAKKEDDKQQKKASLASKGVLKSAPIAKPAHVIEGENAEAYVKKTINEHEKNREIHKTPVDTRVYKTDHQVLKPLKDAEAAEKVTVSAKDQHLAREHLRAKTVVVHPKVVAKK